jgi:hypothetical protein
MFAPFFEIVAVNASVQSIFGTAPTRIYPIEAEPGAQYPYAVFSTIFGSPENNISEVPDIDQWIVQVDVFDDNISGLRDAAESLRNVLEPVSHITGWTGEERDYKTKAYKYSFTVEFWEKRYGGS